MKPLSYQSSVECNDTTQAKHNRDSHQVGTTQNTQIHWAVHMNPTNDD